MSKHPKKTTTRNWLRRGLAGILSLALILALLPGAILPAQAAHWAMPYAEKLMEWGVMRGDNGNLALDRAITRAEFVAMMNRAYGYKRLGEMPFPDVSTRDWYYDDINIAYNMGYFKGASGYALPRANLTREQAAVLLTRNMMLQENVGEGLQFSDSRSLSEWSRGLVGAAADMGIISGYSDGSFKPLQNITRGEVASMLVKAVGTMVNTKGEHTLGDVYGNVTVNTAGVKLQNGTIAGNLYLTGGIDLGDVLLENVNVLGEIIISGGGESNSSQSSVTLRNVSANAMTVDSISGQFVTIRAEGITGIGTTTVRTNAYVDDSSLPGYGLSLIIQDGGKLLQLAGNVKEVVNRTPNSSLEVVQGVTDKITMDEYATNSSVLVDGDAQVGDLNLDVATRVEGEGDVENLNVGAAGTTVEQLPDDITIRPGITADINGSNMNSAQAAESSADPRLEAGYPKVKNIAPNSASLVFKTNKPGTIYWAVTAVSDGSVSEDNLIEPPSYGGKILKSGSVKAAAGKTEYTASPALSGLTQDGSYYVSAVFVDNRGQHSPLKVTAFSTPDGTVPAFTSNPYMSRNTTTVAQVTGMPNKSCQLYYALLPKGATAPTPAEFKANAVRGNLGYGVRDVVKNTNVNINVNSRQLDQQTDYVVYLWLTDYDGAKSSRVYSVAFRTPDERDPIITRTQAGTASETAIEMNVTVDEASTVFWTIIPEGSESEATFEGREIDGEFNPDDRALKIKIETGSGKFTKNGRKQISAANANKEVTISQSETRTLDSSKTGTSSYYMYMVAKDAAGNYSEIKKVLVQTKDNTPPQLLRQDFEPTITDGSGKPRADSNIKLVFSENVKGGTGDTTFLKLYEEVQKAASANNGAKGAAEAEAAARNNLARALYDHIRLYKGQIGRNADDIAEACTSCSAQPTDENPDKYVIKNNSTSWVINYCYAQVSGPDSNGNLTVTFPTVKGDDGKVDQASGASALNLASGATYHFVLNDIRDVSAEANELVAGGPVEQTREGIMQVQYFTTKFASVNLSEPSKSPGFMLAAKNKDTTNTTGNTLFTAKRSDDERYGELTIVDPNFISPADAEKNPPQRIDAKFRLDPMSQGNVGEEMCWDMLIWSNNDMVFTLYSRPVTTDENVPWEREGSAEILGSGSERGGYAYVSLTRHIQGKSEFAKLEDLTARDYVIHVDRLTQRGQNTTDFAGWSAQYNVRISVVAGEDNPLEYLSNTAFNYDDRYTTATEGGGVTSIGAPEQFLPRIEFTDTKPPEIVATSFVESRNGRGPYIDVTMNNNGRVNYMVIPLNNLTYTENGATVSVPGPNKIKITDTVLGRVGTNYDTQYGVTVRLAGEDEQPAITKMDKIGGTTNGNPNTGAVLSQPTRTLVMSPGQFNEQTTGIRVKSTESVPAGTGAPIDLSDFCKANSAYFICMVPQGTAYESWADNAVGFYFVTPEAAKPNLQLDIIENTDVRATVDQTSNVSQRLLINSSTALNDVFKKTFSALYTQETGTGTNKLGIGTPWADGLASDIMTRFGGYTVIQAMREDYGNGSVFDYIASDNLKAKVAQDIRNGFGGSDSSLATGPDRPVRITATLQPDGTLSGSTMFNYKATDMQNTEQYICVAVAASTAGSADVFRAAYYVQKQDTDYPKINSVTAGFYPVEGDSNKITGEISINFHKTLYYRVGSTAIYPILHIAPTGTTLPTGVTAGTTPGLVTYNSRTWQRFDYINMSTTGPSISKEHVDGTSANKRLGETTSLSFKVGEVSKPSSGKTTWEITLPADLSNWWGATVPSAGIAIRVTYDWNTGEVTKRAIPRNMQGPEYVTSDYV
ncbi:MAG: S-layer homology domain-containing protein [Clostridiales bacterium]|nr:S-layer homology domain-containing protein [Clostridiales bacterium]